MEMAIVMLAAVLTALFAPILYAMFGWIGLIGVPIIDTLGVVIMMAVVPKREN